MILEPQRRQVVERATDLAGLTPARTGNLSVREGDAFAVTPTGVPYDAFDAEDVPVVGLDGERRDGRMAPSSEVPMHSAIYRLEGARERETAGAIVHTHSPWSTAMAVARQPLPPIHYMIVAVGKRVPVADYAPYGTDALAQNIVTAMDEADSTATFIENHGLVVTGPNLETALEDAVHVESLARLYLETRAAGLEPATLSDAQLETVIEQFESYGQEPSDPES